MGASPLMSIGLRAMSASYASMQATGHNIANANVAGYSRQQAELATAKGQYTGAGFFGKGVDVTTVTRSYDQFLTRAATTAKSMSAMDSARLDRMEQLEKVFPMGENGLGYTVSNFMNGMVDLASRPGDSSTRQVVLARAKDLATRFNSAATQIDALQSAVSEDLRTSITDVNGLARAIARLNDQVASARGLGQPPNDLLDERDRLIDKLGQHLQVSTVSAEDGTMAVFIAGGQRLVLGSIPSKLQITVDPRDPSRSALALDDNGEARVIDENTLGAGDVTGLLKFQNQDLRDGRNLIGQLAVAVAGAMNAQQQLGMSLQQPLGTVPAQPMFAIGAPQALPASSNLRDGSGSYLSEVTLTVTDPSALQAADYELRTDPGGAAGVYQLTRLSSPPFTQSIASGDIVDGMRIDVGDPPPASTDRFLLQPVARAANGLRMLLQDPRDLAAASPLIANLGGGNTGSAGIASLTMLARPPEPAATSRITFTSDTGDYVWQMFDAGGGVIADGAGLWTPDEPIPTPPDDINGFALRLSGVPRAGDSLDIAPTPTMYLASNNGNALAMAALRDAPLVNQTRAADGSLSGGTSATNAYASAMSEIGVRVQTARSASTISESVAGAAELARTQTSGVNLDEEAARLIQFQQSYQAAAKVLQIAQSVFQTLLETAGS